MSTALSESERQLYRQVNQQQQQQPNTTSSDDSSSFSIIALILCAAVTLWFYLSGRHTLADYREKSYRLEMRRRHGIPDSDTRPFDIAYKDVAKKKALEEAKRVQLEEARRQTTARSNIQPDTLPETANGWPNSFDSTPRPLKRPQFGESFSTPPSQNHFATGSTNTSRSEPKFNRVTIEDHMPDQVTDAPTPPGGLPLPDPYAPTPASSRPPESPHRSRKGVKRSASNTNDELLAPVRKKQAKYSRVENDQLSLNSSTKSTDADIEDTDMISQSDGGPSGTGSEGDGEVSEHSLRGVKRHRDSETNTEIGGPTGKPELQKRRLDSRRPASLILRGKKRDRSDQGSMMGDVDLRRSRKRERLYDTSGDIEMLEDIREADSMDEDDGPPESQLSTPTDNLTDELPFSIDPLCQGRRIGEEWTINRQKFKVGYDGRRLRHALVKRIRRKYNMPEDSIHPDAIQQIQVAVEVWLSDEEYKEARDRQELAWQDGSLLSGLPPLSSGPHTPMYDTSWSRSPGSSPLKRDFGRTIIPNPLLESPKAPTGRRFGYSTASSTPLRPSHLGPVRTYSRMEKEENEAAAMARFKEVREAKLAAAAEVKRVEEEKEKEKEKEKAAKEASERAATEKAASAAAKAAHTPGSTAGATFTLSTAPAPKAPSIPTASMFSPSVAPSFGTASKTETPAAPPSMPSMSSRPPVPSFNFSAPTPPPPPSASQDKDTRKADAPATGQDVASFSFSTKPSTPSFNFSAAYSVPKAEDARKGQTKGTSEQSKPTFPSGGFNLGMPAFNFSSSATVPQTEKTASAPADTQSSKSSFSFGAKPTIGGFNFSSAPSVPQAANASKESSAPGIDQQTKSAAQTPTPMFPFTQPSTQKSAFETESSKSTTSTQPPTVPFTKPSTPPAFDDTNKNIFGTQSSKLEGKDESKLGEPPNTGGFNFTSSSSASSSFKSAFGASAFPTSSSAPTISSTFKPSTTPMFGASTSTSAFNFGSAGSGTRKSAESSGSAPSDRVQGDANASNPKDGSIFGFGRPVKGLPNSRGSPGGPGEKPPSPFNFGQSATTSTPPPTSQPSAAPAFNFGTDASKEKNAGSTGADPTASGSFNFGAGSNAFSFSTKPSDKQS